MATLPRIWVELSSHSVLPSSFRSLETLNAKDEDECSKCQNAEEDDRNHKNELENNTEAKEEEEMPPNQK